MDEVEQNITICLRGADQLFAEAKLLFYHSITEFVFLMNILGKRSHDLPFSRKSNHKKEKSTVSFTHEQNIICSQAQLDSIAHEQTIINL